MVETPLNWQAGAVLEEHSRRKHKVVREYFARYLFVRCQHPAQARFRVAIVDGFAGGGRYRCGSPGSPIIFLEELRAAADAFNLRRAAEGMSALDIECLLILNDFDRDAIELLKSNVAPILGEVNANVSRLHLSVVYRNAPFDLAYPEIKTIIESGGFQNVLFNLDQYGHSKVDIGTLRDIITSFTSSEIFYTFGIKPLLAFLQSENPVLLKRQLGRLGVTPQDMARLDGLMNKDEWLGIAEQLVFESFKRCANFVSPFSINNPDGWRYWLIHMANASHRARQEYNNVLHQNKSSQAHFGRSGLNMLSYDPSESGSMLYMFDDVARKSAREQLYDDIPNLVARFGDVIGVDEFYASIYNNTPAHMDDIHFAIMENPDLEVVTDGGGERQKPNTIRPGDTLRLKRQLSFYSLFGKEKG